LDIVGLYRGIIFLQKLSILLVENKVHLVFLWCDLGDLWSFLCDRISHLLYFPAYNARVIYTKKDLKS